jgi:signal transduction histidine kinase
LNDLLDLARIEARRGKDFCYEQVNLCALLDDWVQGYQRPWGRKAPELDLPAEPVFVMADPGKLRQALMNVVSNAYKYSPKTGAVRIKLEVQRVSGQPPAVCMDVVDQGIGMTPEQRARVCERFYRADTSGKTLGTGLGMSIVKEIVELHHGNLGIESTLGHGTRVRLCLPSLAAGLDNPLGAGSSRHMSGADAAAPRLLSTDTTI